MPDQIPELDQGVAFGPGCQPSASAPDGSSQSGIPNAALAPMPEPRTTRAIALIATRGMDGLVGPSAWNAAEIGARHGYLYGWYAAIECAANLDADTLQAAAQAIEARSAATAKTGAVEDESAVAESDAPKGDRP